MIVPTVVPAALCGLLFVVSGILFLITGARRRKLGPTRGELAQPERRWTYDQNNMVEFVAVLLKRRVPATEPHDPANDTRMPALIYYAETILSIDIKFAVVFALFIVSADIVLANWFAEWPWIVRGCAISACLGGVYGFADVGEDVKLRSIFRHAARAARLQSSDNLSDSLRDEELADASEVDAANALTRIKIASVVGLVAFGIFVALDAVVSRSTGRPASGGTTPSTPPVQPSPGSAEAA